MINCTNRQITLAVAAINTLCEAKLPAKAAYSVSKLTDACQTESKAHNIKREKIFSDAGCTVETKVVKSVDKDGKAQEQQVGIWIHADAEILAKAAKDAEELAETPVEINALPLDIDQFGAAELPGNAFTGLDWAMKGAVAA